MKIFLSVLLPSVMCFHFSMLEEDMLEHTNDKYHMCTQWSTCRPLGKVDMHLITLLNMFMPRS